VTVAQTMMRSVAVAVPRVRDIAVGKARMGVGVMTSVQAMATVARIMSRCVAALLEPVKGSVVNITPLGHVNAIISVSNMATVVLITIKYARKGVFNV